MVVLSKPVPHCYSAPALPSCCPGSAQPDVGLSSSGVEALLKLLMKLLLFGGRRCWFVDGDWKQDEDAAVVGATGRRTRQEEEEENGGVDCKFLSQLREEEENRKIEEGAHGTWILLCCCWK